MYRDISPDILDNWLGGPKNGILTVWHKMIPASAMLVLVLERMRVSPSSWGEGGGDLACDVACTAHARTHTHTHTRPAPVTQNNTT